MKQYFRNRIYSIILPRGRNYSGDKSLEVGWEKVFIRNHNKQICILTKCSQISTSRGIVILSHPYLSDAKQFFLKHDQAKIYIENGLDVIIMDYNGFGESPFIDFNYMDDLRIVGDYARKKHTGLPIFGHGVSFGASHLINYCGSDHPFYKVIIENCLDSNLTYYQKRNKKLYKLIKLLIVFFPKANAGNDYLESIKKIHQLASVLFIYNLDDTLTTINMGHQLKNNCPIASEMVIFEGKHLEASIIDPDRYAKVTTSFFSSDISIG